MIKENKTRKIIIPVTFIVIVFIVISSYFLDKAKRCEEKGYARDNAEKIALQKIKVDFNTPSFMLKKEQFDNYDKSWMFTYYKDNCVVDVIVDKCGVSDIGGLTQECLPFQK